MRTTPAKKALKQVARGFMFLDEHGPRNWREHIKRGTSLLMNNCRMCLLGQLYGHYGDGVNILGLADWRARRRYGFDSTWHAEDDAAGGYQIDYNSLEDAIERLLDHRPNLPQTGPPWRSGRC